MPNPFGGRGLPRYIKQAAEVPQQEYYYDYSMAGAVQYDYPSYENQEEPQEETTAENEAPVEVEAAPATAVDNQA
jgi:hypothetical protein